MANKKVDVSQFYVVHFVHKPFKTIDYYVCVPYRWAIYKLTDKKFVVAYPKREDPIVTRERIKKKEKHKDEWKFCLAELKYQTNTYDDAELWISKENNHRLSIQANSSTNDARHKISSDQESCWSNQKHSSKSKDKSERTVKPYQIPEKPSLKDTDKRSSDNSKKSIFLKRVNWSMTGTAKSTAQNTDPQQDSSKTEQSITIRDKQSTESKTEKTTAANGIKSTEGTSQSSKQNNHKPRELDPSLPVIDLDEYTEVINSKGHSQQEQPRKTNGSQNQLASNSTVAPKLPSPVEQTTQPNQHNNQTFKVTDIQTLITPSNNHEPRVADQVENFKKNVAITSQKPSNAIDPSKPLRMPSSRPVLSTQQPLPANIQNPGHRGPSITNRINCTLVEGMPISFQEIQQVARINVVRVNEPKVIYTTASVTAPQNIPKPHQHPIFVRQDVQQNLPAPQEHMQQTRRQELPPKPTGHRLDPRLRSESRPISELTQHQPIRPSFNNDPTSVPSQFHQPPVIQHQAQKTVSQQDAQQSQYPAYVPILPTNNRQSPTLQEVEQTTPSSTSSGAPISMNQAILTAFENSPLNEQEIQAILNRISKEQSKPTASNSTSYQSPRTEPPQVHQNIDQYPRTQTQQVNRSDETNLMTKRHFQDDTVKSATNQTNVNNITSQTILCMQEPLSPSHSAVLDSGLDTDHKTPFSYEILDEAHQAVNETNQTEYYSGNRSTAQNSLSKLAMQQKMVEQFVTVCTQVISTFQDTANTFDNLRSSLLQTFNSYQTFRINTSENSASHEPSSSNVTQEVSSVVEERQTTASERRNSNNGNQTSNYVTKAPERIHQRDSRRHSNSTQQFTLPPEYDPNNTKWTLKYQAHMPGLQELIPNSNIYVRSNELKRFEQVSNSYQLLARLLLHEVFNEKALCVCATMTEIVQIHSKMSPDGRPALDHFGFLVLLSFITQYASRSGWCIDVSEVINAIDLEVKEVRNKSGGKSRS